MYSAVIPSYHSEEKEEKKNEIIRADDPQNKDKVKKILFG
jgi:hypothetical protein